MISQIRSQIDENNSSELDDTLDVLSSINRGFDVALGIVNRRYQSSLVRSLDVSIVPGQDTYPIPDDAFSEDLVKVEVRVGGYYQEVRRVDYKDATNLEAPIQGVPQYYEIVGNEYRTFPAPAGITGLRIWYTKDPGPLVMEHGRVSVVGVAGLPNYCVLESLLSDTLSTDVPSEEAFVNWVDGATGEIRASLQVASISNNRVAFRPTPSRTEVQGRTIVGAIPSTAKVGDYICPIDGSCIPPLRKPLTGFLIAHATADIQAVKFGGDAGVVFSLRDKFEDEVKSVWAGRENSLRVKRKSTTWGGTRGRIFWGAIR